MSTYWLGVDIGTGGSRALLLDANGKEAAAVSVPHQDMTMHQPLWAEQDPGDWADAAFVAIRGALAAAGASGKEIRGVGVSGQMHGLVILDRDHQVIRPALIWCDQRSQPQVDWINEHLGDSKMLEWTANPVLTGFTLPKLLWVRDHEPQQFARVRHLLLPKDYVRFRLTGELATDVSDASGTALFDVARRRWSLEAADGLGLDRSILPTAYESSDVTGTISEEAAKMTGLAAGTPVAGGGGDQASGAVGNGIVQPGAVSCTLGTSGVVFAHMEEVVYDPQGRVHTFCHAVRDKWHVMGVTQGAGLSLQWFRNQLAPGVSYDELLAEAAQSPPGAHGLYWIPYLMGERTPHLDAAARGGWIGLTAKHTRADLIRALIEGISYSQKDGLDLIAAMGVNAASVRASGGGARSRVWRQILADVFGTPVATLASQEGAALGAAILAMVATGEYTSVPEACEAIVRDQETVEPRREEVRIYAAGHAVYRSLYPALKPLFPMM
ncbi:MAG: xylulokinase [Bryobacteraceae bacterium]